ncbi:MAG: NAD(P)/FAD-dependent oxidoreductase [Firmicutes bacterium]|nr:NAD(P)/FAD-dependent oxidoreductase [Bacillota bacterium]
MPNKNIVILGAGYGGVRAAQQLSSILNESEYKVILINKNEYHTFMTQLYQPAAGTKNLDDVMVPINEIINKHKVSFIKGTVDSIDLKNKLVKVNNGEIMLSYEYIINALGNQPEFFGIEGLKENSISLNSLNNAGRIWCRIEKILEELSSLPKDKRNEKITTFVVGGGGLTGVEFAGQLAHQLQQVGQKHNIEEHEYRIILVEGSNHLLPGMSNSIYNYAHEKLEELGVEVVTGDLIKKATRNTIYLASGREIAYDSFVWAGGIRGNRVASESGMKTDPRDRVVVNRYLQYVEDSSVYVIGDSALAIDPKTGEPVIATAQAAIQQGTAAAYNIYADIKGGRKREYRPSMIFLLIHVGPSQAAGEAINKLNQLKLKGNYAAWLKNLIPLKYNYMLGGLKRMLGKPKLGKPKRDNIKYQLHNCNNYK